MMERPLSLPPADGKTTADPFPTRERSPLRVWRSPSGPLDPWGIGGQPYRWVYRCDGCWQGSEAYDTWSWAFANATDHARTCPSLRLARLEAELEKLAETLRVEPGGLVMNGSWFSGFRYGLDFGHGELAAILARHRSEADA